MGRLHVFPDRPAAQSGRGHPERSAVEDPSLKADIHIGDHHSAPLGRVSTQAWLFTHSPGADVIPRLHDAKVKGMAQLGISINGEQEVDGVLYAQSWWCRTV